MLRILLCAALLAGAARADCEKDSDCKAGPLQAGFLYAYRLNSKMQLAAGP